MTDETPPLTNYLQLVPNDIHDIIRKYYIAQNRLQYYVQYLARPCDIFGLPQLSEITLFILDHNNLFHFRISKPILNQRVYTDNNLIYLTADYLILAASHNPPSVYRRSDPEIDFSSSRRKING